MKLSTYIAIMVAILLTSCTTRQAEPPLIVAHRGASQIAPENTIPAFELAWQQGADAIEGDFHLTKDGYIVCIHDSETRKYSDRNLVVAQSTLSELQELDVGGKSFKGTVIPTISEVFSTIPEQKKIYIEIKSGIEIIPILLNEIDKSGLKEKQIVVISFDKNVIKEMKSQAPQYETAWLSWFQKDKSGKVNPSLETVLETLVDINADGLGTPKYAAAENFVKAIMEKGFEHHVWTVNDARAARKFKEWGTKSIITDTPSYIGKAMVEQDATLDADKPHQ